MSATETKPDFELHDDSFWRAKLAESLGLSPTLDDEFLNRALASHLSWRGKHARSIGVSPDLNDVDLLKAHARHIASVRQRNSGAAMLENERARNDMACSFVNELVARGVQYDTAFRSVHRTYPNLLKA
jgi:hypothetical protein